MYNKISKWLADSQFNGTMELASYITLILFLLLIGPSIWLTVSYFEAQSYNRVTGKDMTMWDAMWLELRVDTPPK